MLRGEETALATRRSGGYGRFVNRTSRMSMLVSLEDIGHSCALN
jgi:hypothetical protein